MPDAYIAWPFVAKCDMVVNQIQLYTNGGTWWIANDVGGNVGAILTGGPLPESPSAQWVGPPPADVFQLIAGQAYWMIQGAMLEPAITTASVAEGGVPLACQHSAALGGPWVACATWFPLAVQFAAACN